MLFVELYGGAFGSFRANGLRGAGVPRRRFSLDFTIQEVGTMTV